MGEKWELKESYKTEKELSFVIPVRDFQIFLLEITINLGQNIANFYLVH